MKRENIFGIPVRINPLIPKDQICLYDKNGPRPVVEVPDEAALDTLYRAIDGDADFLRRCGIIIHINDIKEPDITLFPL